jgi:precorrin-6B methylase 2
MRSVGKGLFAATLAVLIGIGLESIYCQQAGATKTVTLKLLLPQDDAEVKVDGKEIEGEGEERTIKSQVDAKKDTIVVSAFWEPNNYTKFTRRLKVNIKEDKVIIVDLRKKQPDDDIVIRFVPTPQDVVEAMCKMAKVGKDDVVYDLGCGDGRMVITAVQKFGAKRGVGVDLDPERIKDSKENAKKAGVEGKVEFRIGDVTKVKDLSDATVVLLYMGDDVNLLLRPILKKTLKPGSRIVSHRFEMGDWKPDRKETVQSNEGDECDILLWVIQGKNKK